MSVSATKVVFADDQRMLISLYKSEQRRTNAMVAMSTAEQTEGEAYKLRE